MRQLASFLLLGLSVAAGAADTWRWKDANGVVHYSDRPVPGATLVTLGPQAAPANPEAALVLKPDQAPAAPTVMSYTGCMVTAPANDEVFNNERSVRASLQITPGLQQGHRMQVLFDGQPYPAWPAGGLSHTFNDLFRGTHTLRVNVVDAAGRSLCSGPAVSFHVRLPSLLSPARQAARP
ncbi:MAG: DUF4124 domain-containing protein [Steroidobacteraceae bacterium]